MYAHDVDCTLCVTRTKPEQVACAGDLRALLQPGLRSECQEWSAGRPAARDHEQFSPSDLRLTKMDGSKQPQHTDSSQNSFRTHSAVLVTLPQRRETARTISPAPFMHACKVWPLECRAVRRTGVVTTVTTCMLRAC